MKQDEILLYNTETRQLEPLRSSSPHELTMYTCGPTVYHFAHIGNFRTFVFEDVLRRTLLYFGYSVRQVMNLTDIDDKTIKGALAKHITLKAFTEPYSEAFFEDIRTLNIQRAEEYPKATDYIPKMIAIIEDLVSKKVAYQGKDGSIYFRIDKFASYGRLSHLCLHDLKSGASERVLHDEYDKEHVSDFVLWKAYDKARDGDIFWESPFGKGRPGWHIECSAMALSLLGDTIDIHVGAVDNMFPHHENEIAQSEAFTGKQFVKHWLHSEHLIVDGKKMSKSLGNFYTLRDLLNKGFHGPEIRFLLLSTHYRTQLNFSFQGVEAARHTLRRVEDFALRLKEISGSKTHGEAEKCISKARNAFKAALAHDLAISEALAALFDFIRDMNTLCDEEKIGKEEAKDALNLLREFDQVLGCLPIDVAEDKVPVSIQELFDKRQKARQEKKWRDADKFRDELFEHGYIVEDTPSGTKLKKKI